MPQPDVSNELAQLYRNVFSTNEGKVVLFHMLEELGFHQIIQTEEERIMKNYAMRLIFLIGGGRLDQSSVTIFLNSLMRQPLPEEEKREE